MLYNRETRKTKVTYGQKKPVLCEVEIPALGCLMAYNNSGYGDCSTCTYIVTGYRNGKALCEDGLPVVTQLELALVIKIDIGKGPEAAPEPQHAGHVSYATDQRVHVKLCYLPSENLAWYKTEAKANASYSPGQYVSRCIGIDK